MKVTVTARPSETQTFEGEGDDYEAAKAAAEAKVPAGWTVLQVRQVR